MADHEERKENSFDDNLEFLKKKGYSWTREETRLLISLYEEKQDLFKNINYKKKQVWEIIASRMKEHDCTARPDQCEGKWKALTLAFRKCEDHNHQSGNNRRECPFYQELSEVYGYRPNVRPYATASSSGLGDSRRSDAQGLNKNAEVSNEDSTSVNLTTGQQTKRTHEETRATPKKKARRSSTSQDECLTWFKEHTEERRRENERRLERLEQQHREKMSFLSGLLDVLKDLNK